jgi:hypothetical protein
VPLVEALTTVLQGQSFSHIPPHLDALTLNMTCIAEMVEMRRALAGSLRGIAQLKHITCDVVPEAETIS